MYIVGVFLCCIFACVCIVFIREWVNVLCVIVECVCCVSLCGVCVCVCCMCVSYARVLRCVCMCLVNVYVHRTGYILCV